MMKYLIAILFIVQIGCFIETIRRLIVEAMRDRKTNRLNHEQKII